MSTKKSDAQVPDIFRGHEGHNCLLPTKTYYQNVGPMQRVSVETVEISSNPGDGDVYKLREGQFPLSKRGLEKIAHAAGISFHPEYSRVEEHRANYCRYKAVGAMRKADGTLQIVTGTYFIDLEQDQKAGMSDDRLKQRRQFIVQLCESGAKNRAIRSLLGLKSNYTAAELSKPFAVPRIDFAPDLSDPQTKRYLLDQATQATTSLYPPTGTPIHAEHRMIENGETEEAPEIQEDDGLDGALTEPDVNHDIEQKIAVFREMSAEDQTATFAVLVSEKGVIIGPPDDPSELRKLWRKDRVKAYRELLEWGGNGNE